MDANPSDNQATNRQQKKESRFHKPIKALGEWRRQIWASFKTEAHTVRFWIEVFALIGLGIYTTFAALQWLANKKAAEAASSTATTADATLNEIQEGGTDTHHLATAAGDQARAMLEQLDLQREIAAMEHGAARVRVEGIAIYHEGQDIYVDIGMQNTGNKKASQISVSGRLGFREVAPVVIPNTFVQFIPATITELEPRNRQKPVVAKLSVFITGQKSKGEGFYVWGVIRYIDWRNVDIPDRFCEYLPAKVALDSSEGRGAGKGKYFSAPQGLEDCKY